MAAVLYSLADIRGFLEKSNTIKYASFFRREDLFGSAEWMRVVPRLSDWTMRAAPDAQTVIEPGAAIAFDQSGIPPWRDIPGVNRLQCNDSHAHDLVLQTYTDVHVAFCRHGFAVWRGNELFAGSSATPRFSPGEAPEPVPLDRMLYIGDMTKTDNICHFTFDYLARAVLGRQLVGLDDAEIMFPISANDYQRHIKAATFPDAPEYSADTVYKVRTLHLFQDSTKALNHPARHCDSRVLSFLRENVLRGVARSGDEGGKYYLSRRDSPRIRPMLNEIELEEMLAGLGYTVVQMSKFPPAEQIRMAATARAIIAPHGAALTSIVFCDPGTRIVEIMNRNVGTLCYFKIAQWAKLDYRMVVAQSGDGEHSMRVDLDEIAGLCG